MAGVAGWSVVGARPRGVRRIKKRRGLRKEPGPPVTPHCLSDGPGARLTPIERGRGREKVRERVKVSVPNIVHNAKVARGHLLSGCVSGTAALVRCDQMKK